MKVVEDFFFESRPHQAVSSVVQRDKEIQEYIGQKLLNALPGFCGGMLPGRSTKEKGRYDGEEEEDSRERQHRN